MKKSFLSLIYDSDSKDFDLSVFQEIERKSSSLTSYQITLLEILSLCRVEKLCKEFGKYEKLKNVLIIPNTMQKVIDLFRNNSFDIQEKYNFGVSIEKLLELYDTCLDEENIVISSYLKAFSISEVIEHFLSFLDILSKGTLSTDEPLRGNLSDVEIYCNGIYLPARIITLYYDQKYENDIYQNPALLINEYGRIEKDFDMVKNSDFILSEYLQRVECYRNVDILEER